MKLQNKTALITGGSSGIGLATAQLFVAEGARVAITGRDQEKLDTVARALGPGVLAIKADCADAEAMGRAVALVVEKLGKLDVVFANAGIAFPTPLATTSLAAFEQILRTNLGGVFLTVQCCMPHLNEGASVILNGSVHAVLGVPGYAAYAASKAGLRAMGRVMASELASRRVRVNLVTPGAVKTPIWSVTAPTPEAMAALEARLVRSIPLERLGEASEIAKVVAFLASDDASNIQAAEIVVDGGHSGAPAGAPIFRR
jgi:NAD(P)-dependent dehydrogenase (short-subunit alcohol dehydrogenase family)